MLRARSELSTYEWVALTDAELGMRRRDPADRVLYTGHTTHVRRQWLDSIGRWGACETFDVISKTEPHKAVLHVTHDAFKKFKSRHALMTARQFARVHGPHAWTKAELCYDEHQRAQRALGMSAYPAPIGSACAYAVATSRAGIGLLPIEVVLWTRIFDDLLGHHGLELDDWHALEDSDKAAVWEKGRNGQAWSLDGVAHAPAVLCLQAALLEAAE